MKNKKEMAIFLLIALTTSAVTATLPTMSPVKFTKLGSDVSLNKSKVIVENLTKNDLSTRTTPVAPAKIASNFSKPAKSAFGESANQSNINNEHTSSTPFGSVYKGTTSLKGDIYYLSANTSKLPDFSKLTPVGSIYTNELNVALQSSGVQNRDEFFGIVYTGNFVVSKAGKYGFRLLSDDGSRLLIDGNIVVFNEGSRSVTGNANLTQGLHKIEVDYFQIGGLVALQLFWTPPGGTEVLFTLQSSPDGILKNSTNKAIKTKAN